MQLLHDGSEILFSEVATNVNQNPIPGDNEYITINLPVIKPEKAVVPVIEIILK